MREARARQELAHVCTHHQRALRYCNTPLSRSAKETAADAPGKHRHSKKGTCSESGRIAAQRHLLCPLPPSLPSPVPALGTSSTHSRDSRKPGAPVRNSLFPSHLSPHRASPLGQVHLYTPHSAHTELRAYNRTAVICFP